jgi:ubiquinone/menaquinone biosynthesis C-methylase UbiE
MNAQHIAILQELLQRSAQLRDKDGSQGLDVLASLMQYVKAYACVDQHIKPGARVLDWGGGSGHFSFFLKRCGYLTSIYSFSTPLFVQAEIENKAIQYTSAASSEPIKLPYPDASFDAVCSIGVLEHVRETGGNERGSLAEIRRILKPDGVFLCYHFPNKYSWIEFLARRFGSYHHAYTYDAQSIHAIFDGLLHVQHQERYAILPRNSLRRLPVFLVNRVWFSRLFDMTDRILSRFLRPWNQNWLIVARKKA